MAGRQSSGSPRLHSASRRHLLPVNERVAAGTQHDVDACDQESEAKPVRVRTRPKFVGQEPGAKDGSEGDPERNSAQIPDVGVSRNT
jgi:hypothetical protein